MQVLTDHINEQKAAKAFTRQSGLFDDLYCPNKIIQYKRFRVRQHLLRYLEPSTSILELNAGTGEDAIFFARRGHAVHATDISLGMQNKLLEKVAASRLSASVSTEICSFNSLDQLINRGPYHCIFSNFAGLNCTDELNKVLDNFTNLLRPGGIATLVVLPKFCLWETLLILKGKFKTATRRFFARNGTNANLDGAQFKCWYYSPAYIVNRLAGDFNLLDLEALCTFVPPSYIEDFVERYPQTYSLLRKLEDRFRRRWPWKYIGDYYIITLKKREADY